MNKPVERSLNKAVDSIQQRLTSYACDLSYDGLSQEAIHAAKVRIIDTLGALIGGFFGEPCFIARNLAAKIPNPDGATIIGTRMKTTPDMAAFVNATTARYPELCDVNHSPGSFGGHPSDVVTSILAVAEHAQASGREFITGVVLGYEVYFRISDALGEERGSDAAASFDHTTFCCLATAVAAGKLLGLSADQLSHCISMAAVSNNILRQSRVSHLSMFKVVATGQAGRGGVFAALLAQAGMEGPHLPFEGKAGWCDHVAGKRFSLDTMGGHGTPFKVPDTRLKIRPTSGTAASSLLAAEKVGPLKTLKDIKRITVEVYGKAKEHVATGEQFWHPDTRESADHSAPYLVAAALMDGTVTLRSFNDAHLKNPELRALMKKIEFVENDEFTKAYNRRPQEHHTRVTVLMESGERLVGETGGGKDDMGQQMSDAQITDKFRGLTEDFLGAKQVNSILDRLWTLEDLKDIAEIPPAFVLD